MACPAGADLEHGDFSVDQVRTGRWGGNVPLSMIVHRHADVPGPIDLGRCRTVLYHGTSIMQPTNARADSPAPMPLFAANDLTCLRGERLVFQGLSFAMDTGGALVLLGPNGSGKSSLLRLMAG